MKKSRVLLGFVLISMSLLLQGCFNTKTLECKEINGNNSAELILKYRNDKLYSMKAYYKMDLSSYSDEQIEEIKKEDTCDEISRSILGIAAKTCNKNISSKLLTIDIEADISKIKEENLDTVNSITKTKETFENNSKATCEIK